MKLRNPMFTPAETTVLIEQGYLESDGLTPTVDVLAGDEDMMLEDYENAIKD